MKKTKLFKAILVFSILFLINSCSDDAKIDWVAPLITPPHGIIKDQYIVSLKSDFMKDYHSNQIASNRKESAKLAEEKRAFFKIKVRSLLAILEIPESLISSYYSELFYGFSAQLNELQLNKLLHHLSVEIIENDMTVSLPDYKIDPGPSGLRAQTMPCGITNAGGPGDGSTSSKWIWIVDTGIDLDHPDLNVETDPAYAKSFVLKDPSPDDDCNGHGTHVAGIAAAIDNSTGVVGVSAGAKVVPIKVLGCTGGGRTTWILSGLDHIAANDEAGDVVNMSLGSFWGSKCSWQSRYVKALTNLSNSGTRIALAAGNDANDASIHTPGCINAENIHTVASMTCSKEWSWFSNYGAPPIDWIATGSDVYSTHLNGGYMTYSGTSMSAPHVAGILHNIQSSPIQNGSVTQSGVIYKIASRQ